MRKKRIKTSLAESRVLAYSTSNSNLGNYKLRQSIIATNTDNVLYDDEINKIKVESFHSVLDDIYRTSTIRAYKCKAQAYIVNLALKHTVSERELNLFIHRAMKVA